MGDGLIKNIPFLFVAIKYMERIERFTRPSVVYDARADAIKGADLSVPATAIGDRREDWQTKAVDGRRISDEQRLRGSSHAQRS